MLDLVKISLWINTDAYDSVITMLINDCVAEMTSLGVIGANADSEDPQIQSAVVSYVGWKSGYAEREDEFKEAYRTKLSQLKTTSGYTDWGVE